MSYKIRLGTFSKLEKSTAQPSTASWADYDVNLKNGCDLLDPEVTLSVSEATIAPYNYATMFGKYFFIADKYMLRENLCVLQLRHDPMATYKSQIGSANLYVLRSASAHNGLIRDNYYPIKADMFRYHQVQSTGVPGDFSTGVIVVNIAGTNTAGATTLLQFTPDKFSSLVKKLYTDIDGFQLSDVIATVVKKFGGNPQALINGAMWFPYAFDVDAVSENITIGSWSSNVSGGRITDPVMTLSDVQFTLHKHPQASSRGDYLNMAPYSEYSLGVPGCGVVRLDNNRLLGQTGITIHRRMDAFTGQLIVEVLSDDTPTVLAYLSGQIGLPITLRGSNDVNSIIGGVSSAVTAGLAIGSGGSAGLIAGALEAGISSAMDIIGGTGTSSSMGRGAAAIMDAPIWLDEVFNTVTDADNTEHGRPLCEMRTISTLSGFIQVSDGNVKIPGTITEQREIKSILESGFFYE